MSEPQPISERVESLEAYILSLEEGAEAGLEKLAGKETPDAIRRQLMILLDNERFAEAISLIEDIPPHERWYEKGIATFVLGGEPSKAKTIVDWARSQEDPSLGRIAALTYGTNLIQHLWSGRDLPAVVPSSLTESDQAHLWDAINTLEPLCSIALADHRIRTSIEQHAIEALAYAHYLVGDGPRLKTYCELLETQSPVPLIIARLALQEAIDLPIDLPQRLRKEHPSGFEPEILACLVEGRVLGRVQEAFDSARQLLRRVDTPAQQEEVLKFLRELAYRLGDEASAEVDVLAPFLLERDSALLDSLQAQRLLQRGETDKAAELVEKLRDDTNPEWLQLHAHVLLQRGKGEEASNELAKAVSILPNPDLLRFTVQVAYQNNRHEVALAALQKLLSINPDDVEGRRRAGMLHAGRSDWTRAMEHFSYLAKLTPTDVEAWVNTAIAHYHLGNLHESLSAFDHACGLEDAPVEALVGRARVLRLMSRPKEALASLLPWKESFWDNQAYLSAILDLGFAADSEELGHAALVRLRELQDEGTVAETMIVEKSIDDIGELIRQRVDTRQRLAAEVIAGRMPWLFAAAHLNSPSVLAWMRHTQSVMWVFERHVDWADNVVYATNSFAAVGDDEEARTLHEISCVPQGSPVVADITALTTLHHLGLLTKTAEYFGRIVVPAPYQSRMLEETARLLPRQLSQITTLGNVRNAVETRMISVVPDNDSTNLRRVDEYSSDERNVPYVLCDVIEVLHRSGGIDDQLQSEALKHLKPKSNMEPLQPGSSLLMELSSLRTLSHLLPLELIAGVFEMSITDTDWQRVLAETRVSEWQDAARKHHETMWGTIRGDHRYVQEAGNLGEEGVDFTDQRFAIAAAVLATKAELPLMADDRFSQGYVFHHRPHAADVAFGTFEFLRSLHFTERITDQEFATHLMQLIRWRYRFLVFPVAALVTVARRYASHPPGRELIEIANYVHDCMRDPGLPCGTESASGRSSIGTRFLTAWGVQIGGFLMSIWTDDAFSEDQCLALTQWAGAAFVPSIPVGLEGWPGASTERMVEQLIMGGAVWATLLVRDVERANLALRAIADALCITPSEYSRLVVGVINGR